jgi:hypothetical protein
MTPVIRGPRAFSPTRRRVTGQERPAALVPGAIRTGIRGCPDDAHGLGVGRSWA